MRKTTVCIVFITFTAIQKQENTVQVVYFVEKKFCEFRVLEKNYTQKTKIYMVHALFLTNSRKFNPAKYTTYTVGGKLYVRATQFVRALWYSKHREYVVAKADLKCQCSEATGKNGSTFKETTQAVELAEHQAKDFHANGWGPKEAAVYKAK